LQAATVSIGYQKTSCESSGLNGAAQITDDIMSWSVKIDRNLGQLTISGAHVIRVSPSREIHQRVGLRVEPYYGFSITAVFHKYHHHHHLLSLMSTQYQQSNEALANMCKLDWKVTM